MQNVDTQEVNTTEQKIEVYANDIELYLHQYCIDHGIKDKDLYTIDQSRWNSVLLYIYKHVFKPLKTDVVFFASTFWRKMQNIFGECCISKLEKVARPRLAAILPAT